MSSKMVLIVRTDLKMGKGKIGSQCGHGSILAYKQGLVVCPEAVKTWEMRDNQKKIVLGASLEEFEHIRHQCNSLKIPNVTVVDAGKTQIQPNSETVLAIGPVIDDFIDPLTRNLKLL